MTTRPSSISRSRSGRRIRLRLLLLLCTFSHVAAQQTFSQIDTVFSCLGTSTLLSAPIDFEFFRWSPIDGLSSAFDQRVFATPQESQLYTVESTKSIGPNLIANADIDDGNTNFTSDYIFSPSGSSASGSYGVVSLGSDQNPQFADCVDAEQPGQKFLAFKGSTSANQNVWCQSVSVSPNTSYRFGVYVATLDAGSLARIGMRINDLDVGRPTTVDFQTCIWKEFTRVFNSGGNATIEICLQNENTDGSGNGFALDRFTLRTLSPIQRDSFYLQLQDEISTTDSVTVCEGSPFTRHGLSLSSGQSGSVLLRSSIGCDSTVNYFVQSLDTTITTTINDTLCKGDVIEYRNVRIESDTIIYDTLQSVGGCDSIISYEARYFNNTNLIVEIEDPKCFGSLDGSISLSATAGQAPYSYAWSNSSITPDLFDIGAGAYAVSVEDASGCQIDTTLYLANPPPISIDSIISYEASCAIDSNGQFIVIESNTVGPTTITITSGNISFDADKLIAGNYTVTLTDSLGCSDQQTAVVNGPPVLDVQFSGPSYLPIGELGSFSVLSTNTAASIDWFINNKAILELEDRTDIIYRPMESGVLEVSVTDQYGCSSSAFLDVEIQPYDDEFFPNAFSPNGDGVNDYFGPAPDPALKQMISFQISDRWGNLLFNATSCDPLELDRCSWDGKSLGTIVSPGVYVYYAKILLIDGVVIDRIGEVNLIR